jgi:hypothetical protein
MNRERQLTGDDLNTTNSPVGWLLTNWLVLPVLTQLRSLEENPQFSTWRTLERSSRAEGIASEPHRHLARKLQLALDRLEARLLAQGVQERVGL